jgi:nucleoside-diphosphate-sugar epimerase
MQHHEEIPPCYHFGVVSHRFCAQAIAEYPLTVYGKGQQRKPFISLEDAVEGWHGWR